MDEVEYHLLQLNDNGEQIEEYPGLPKVQSEICLEVLFPGKKVFPSFCTLFLTA